MPNLIKRILTPVRLIVNRLSGDLTSEALKDPSTRDRILRLADAALVSEFPAARLIPATLRHRIIGQVLDAVVGDPTSAIASAAAVEADEIAMLNLSAEEAALLEAAAPGNSIDGFLVDGETSDAPAVSQAVDAVLGAGWTVTATEKDGISFRVTHPDRILSLQEAWDLAHQLEEQPSIDLAEPSIEWVPATADIGGAPPDVATIAGFGDDDHKLCSNNVHWNGDTINVQAAWDNAQTGRKQGKGIRIGHLDTGIRPHNFMANQGNPQIEFLAGRNLYDPGATSNSTFPFDPLTAGMGNQPGHGTQTLSVILCKSGTFTPQGGMGTAFTPAVRGVAPESIGVPFRISPTVINFNTDRITKGMRAALDAGCDVITMSMGGPEPRTKDLRRVIQRAVESGVIICTAAGNKIGSNNITPIVVWPAAYDEVIAVAGCNCEDKTWSGSSRGPEVNIAAPAESVWRLDGGNASGVDRGAGTSYATPAVAGIAACWLAHHGGRAVLGAHYGHAKYVPLAFAHILKTVGHRRPAGWDTRLMGPGILDAGRVLQAPLPPKSALGEWPRKEHTLSSKVLAGIIKSAGWVKGIFGGGSPAAATAAVAAAEADLTTSSAEELVARYGTELQQILFDRPLLLQQLADAGLLEPDLDDGTPGVAAAAAAEPTLDLDQAQKALSALAQLASPSLAAVLN
jgi:serine protease